jgi:hypothetical protein
MMSPTLTGRMALVLTATAAMLLGPVGAGAASPAPDPGSPPVQLSLKPMNQAAPYFDLTLEAGQAGDFSVELGNHGAESIATRTYAADAYSIVNGGFDAENRDSEGSGTTTWLSYPTEVRDLQPGESSERAFTVSVPSDTLPGQYITSLVLENDVPVAGSGGVALNQVVRQAVAVSVRVPGPLAPSFAVGSADHTIIANKSVIGVELANTGNANLKPAGRLTVRDSGGTVVSEAPVTMDSVYAGDSTRIETMLGDILEPGGYTLDFALTDAASNAASTGTGLPFTVTADEVDTARSAQPGLLPGVNQSSDGTLPLMIAAAAMIVLLTVSLLALRRWRWASSPSNGRRSARARRGPSTERRH